MNPDCIPVIVECMTASPPLTVLIRYEAKDPKPDDPGMREVEPIEIKGDTLFANDLTRSGALRQFKLARIAVAGKGKEFTPRTPIKPPTAAM